MPANNSTKKQAAVQKTKPKNRTLLIVLAIVIPVIVVFGGLFALGYWVINGPAIKVQGQMTAYLENKYKEDFVVVRPTIGGGGLGVEGVWRAVAYSTSNPSIEFNIQGVESAHHFTDQYVAATWSKAQTARLQQEAKDVFSGINVTVRPVIGISGKLEDVANLSSPTYDEAKTIYPDYLHYGIRVVYDKSYTDTRDMANRLFRITRFIRDTGVKQVDIRYSELQSDGSYRGVWCDQGQVDTTDDIFKCLNRKITVERDDI